MCRIVVSIHRYAFTYSYGYTGTGYEAENSFYEISSQFPQLNRYYGLLAGPVYTIPYSLFGLVAGKMSDQVNRSMFLGFAVILASLTIGASGITNSLLVFAAMRVLHGVFNTSTNPLSFSLLSDYFPEDKRTFGNSMIQAGNYIGCGVSSLLIILISKYGWR